MKPLQFALIGALLLLPPMAAAEDNPFQAGRLSLNATGTVRTAPDMARLNAGVTTTAKTAKAALRSNRGRMNAVFKALKNAGIKERDIKTSNLNVSPIYAPYSNTTPRDQQQRITGYTASNQVVAVVHNLDTLGSAIDALVESGANNIGGISFGLEDQQSALSQARKQAIENVMDKAEVYAKATGFEIGAIVNMSESGGYRPQQQMAYARMESAPTPIAAGQLNSSITVNVTFEIKQ